MRNYVYKMELFSGFYESYFYRQLKAKSEKDAIIQIVSFFTDLDIDNANSRYQQEGKMPEPAILLLAFLKPTKKWLGCCGPI